MKDSSHHHTDSIEQIRSEVTVCTLCKLCQTRTKAVPGEGLTSARIMFVGEAPGRNEDMEGRPFVGSAGKILEDVLQKFGFSRAEVFITNVVKCRPLGNRIPDDEERSACRDYLDREISVICPEIICILGRTAFESILGGKSIMSSRGRFIVRGERKYFLTIHPAATIYNSKLRTVLENDIKLLSQEYKKISSQNSSLLTDFMS